MLPSPSSTRTPHTYQHEDYTLDWPDLQTHPHQIHQKAHVALSEFQLSQRGPELQPILEETSTQSPAKSDEVLIFPIIQAGQFNIREEEAALALLFRLLDSKMLETNGRKRPLVDLTSGYFGLYSPYQELILTSDVETRIVAAGPQVDDHGHFITQN